MDWSNFELEVLPVDVRRKVEQVVGDEKQGDENESLDETARGRCFGPVTKFRRESKGNNGGENDDGPNLSREMERVGRVRVFDGALEFVGGEGISLRLHI